MTELAVYEPSTHNGVALPDRPGHPGSQDFDSWVAVASDVIKLANVIFDTPFVPDGLRGSAPAVAAAILAGREMGIGPMTSLQHIHVIKGKPAQSAMLMRALVLSRGHKWEDGDVSDVRAVVRGCRKGESGWLEVTFTAAQAKAAGIDLGKYPADKLYARATSRLARRKFADVIAGMPYTAEELEDGVADEGTEHEPAPVAPEKPAARTVQRRQAPKTPAAEAAPPEAGIPSPPPQDPALPPLPGEPDYDSPGTATSDQLTALWATFTTDYGFTSDDKAVAREKVEQIIGRTLDGGTTKDLSRNEASAAIDTLKRCGGDYDKLQALLKTGGKPGE